MGLFSKKKKRQYQTVNWDLSDDDYIIEDIDQYLDPHFESILQAAQEVIGPHATQTRIAGGFAANLAGITKEHDDVDIFCGLNQTWKMLHPANNEAIIDECFEVQEIEGSYGRSVKFKYKHISFHLVDFSKLLSFGNSRHLFRHFDLNWAMASICFSSADTLIIHPEARSTIPKLNELKKIVAQSTLPRLMKYIQRLETIPDKEECEILAKYLRHLRDNELTIQYGTLDGY